MTALLTLLMFVWAAIVHPHPAHPEHVSRTLVRPPKTDTSYSAVWDRDAACESGGDWHINTGNGFYGGLQITASNAAHYGFGRPDLLTPAEQVRLAQLVLCDQGPRAWPVCGPRAGLSMNDCPNR